MMQATIWLSKLLYYLAMAALIWVLIWKVYVREKAHKREAKVNNAIVFLTKTFLSMRFHYIIVANDKVVGSSKELRLPKPGFPTWEDASAAGQARAEKMGLVSGLVAIYPFDPNEKAS